MFDALDCCSISLLWLSIWECEWFWEHQQHGRPFVLSKLVMYMLVHTECSVLHVDTIYSEFGWNRKLAGTRHELREAPGVFHPNNVINTWRVHRLHIWPKIADTHEWKAHYSTTLNNVSVKANLTNSNNLMCKRCTRWCHQAKSIQHFWAWVACYQTVYVASQRCIKCTGTSLSFIHQGGEVASASMSALMGRNTENQDPSTGLAHYR